MELEHNVAIEQNKPSRKKPIFPIQPPLRSYLKKYGREKSLPIAYHDLQHFTYSLPIKDKEGKDTHWEKVSYDMREWEYIREALVEIYALLRTEGDLSFAGQLTVARIEYCVFGNSNPFRIRIINTFNDNYDHYYIKLADANRVYGLELEHILSPNRIVFYTDKTTLVEEHIPGIPGDLFIRDWLHERSTNRVRLAKEFVKFNERCFLRLLGDMRSYNYVVDVTPDIEDFQYRIRAIDFDQQSYEGKRILYLPQFFKENLPMVENALKLLNKESIEQYQAEERTHMAYRLALARYRIKELFDIMVKDEIAPKEKVQQLALELAEYYKDTVYLKCRSMGMLVKMLLKRTIQNRLKMIPRSRLKPV